MEDLSAPNTREANVRRYLAKGPPKGAVSLLLEATTNSTTVKIGDWDVKQWAAQKETAPVVANDVMALVIEHAEELEQSVVASLYWASESGQKVGAERVINYRRVAPVLENTGLNLTGDAQAQASQAQRHLEAVFRVALMNQVQLQQATGSIISSLIDQNDRLTDKLVEAEKRERAAVLELQELLEVVAGAGEDKADDERVARAQERILQMFEPLAKLAVAKLASGG